jgi:hypothetical protein
LASDARNTTPPPGPWYYGKNVRKRRGKSVKYWEHREDGRWKTCKECHHNDIYPYRWAEVEAAIRLGRTPHLPDGETDVDALWDLGLPATCSPQGGDAWSARLAEDLAKAGAHSAVIYVDVERNDKGRETGKGLRQAEKKARVLRERGIFCDVLRPPYEKDVRAHLAAGRALAELLPLELDNEVFATDLHIALRLVSGSWFEPDMEADGPELPWIELSRQSRDQISWRLARSLTEEPTFNRAMVVRALERFADLAPQTNTRGESEPYTRERGVRTAHRAWAEFRPSVELSRTFGDLFPQEFPQVDEDNSFSRFSPVDMAPSLDLDSPAFHGLAGEIVRTVLPETEADPAALLFTFLAEFGNLIGPGPHARISLTSHPGRLFVALVGRTLARDARAPRRT